MRRVWVCQASRGLAHPSEPLGIAEQRTDGFDQPDFIQFCFFQYHSSARPLQGSSVYTRMVVGAAWKGNKDSRLPGCRDFRHGARPGAAQQQICSREESGHVINELVNLGRRARPLVRSLRLIIIALAGLMDDVDRGRLLQQLGQALDHGSIDGMCALAATENQQSGLRSRWFCDGLKESLAHRHPSYFCVAEKFGGLLEVYSRCRDPARNYAIGESRHNIWLERQSRNSLHDGRHHRWARGVATNADYDIGTEFD